MLTRFPARAAASLLIPLLLLAPAARALDVVTSSPSPYALHQPTSTAQITLTFDAAPVLPPDDAVRVSGTMSGLHPVTLAVNGAVLTATVGGSWQPGELVHVNVRRDVHTAAADSLDGGHVLAFTIAAAAGPMTFETREVYGAAVVPYFIFGGDLDGDGTPDVAAPNEGTNDFSVWLNSGSGALMPRSDYGVGMVPSSCFGEDLDNDGDLDLATADIASGTMSVSLNHGDGTFAPSVPYAAGTTTRQVFGGDFDGDNDVDLCATSASTDEIYFWFNDGAGSFGAGIPFTDVKTRPFALETGDFDGDGLLDVVVANQAQGSNAPDSLDVLINDGAGWFTRTGRWHAGDGPWDLVVNDFNGDGAPDVGMVTSFNNRIKILINDGSGGFPTRTAAATPAFPLAVQAGDVDGDGDLDLFSSNFNAGSVTLFDNDGAAGLSSVLTLPVNRTGSYTWAHDLDGDGDLDLSVVDELSDSLYVFFNEPPLAAPSLPGGAPGLRMSAWPNPAPASGTELHLAGASAGRVEIDVVDVRGRRVRRLGAITLAGSTRIPWDGKDERGAPVAAGAYVVVAQGTAGRASTVVRILR
ncbi:MAG TPA: VCBS repeat-containing protein [bacterium]|nr:VCBS repeat-containing protein [bacterium]